MPVTRPVAILRDPRFRHHRPPGAHPEDPDRLRPVDAAIAMRSQQLVAIPARRAAEDEIRLVHRPQHLERILRACERAPAQLDPDTYVSEESFEVALLATGGCVDLARAVARGDAPGGFAAVRPPGHHAEADRAMGFCLFNNIAVVARALQQSERIERVMIFDWDVHHGNGTQHLFDEDPSVLYVSTHQFPHYPGTGDFAEAGRSAGLGTTINIPLPAGCGDSEYVGVTQRVVVPAALHYRPEIILISAGFDAHESDPLASMRVTGEGFAAMARIVRELAQELCGGRLVFLLEGGYADVGLHEGTCAVLDALLDDHAPPPLERVDPASNLDSVLRRVADVHGRRIPSLAA